jgi:hypothetical protein
MDQIKADSLCKGESEYQCWESVMRKSERILLLLQGGGEWSGMEVAAVLGLWFGPYAELHRMERDGKIESRWLNMPHPRRRVYFAKGRANAENIGNS